MPGRVAKLLPQLAQQFGSRQDGAMRASHDLTQEEIAQLVGAAREAVNKALTELRAPRASSSIPGPDRASA